MARTPNSAIALRTSNSTMVIIDLTLTPVVVVHHDIVDLTVSPLDGTVENEDHTPTTPPGTPPPRLVPFYDLTTDQDFSIYDFNYHIGSRLVDPTFDFRNTRLVTTAFTPTDIRVRDKTLRDTTRLINIINFGNITQHIIDRNMQIDWRMVERMVGETAYTSFISYMFGNQRTARRLFDDDIEVDYDWANRNTSSDDVRAALYGLVNVPHLWIGNEPRFDPIRGTSPSYLGSYYTVPSFTDRWYGIDLRGYEQDAMTIYHDHIKELWAKRQCKPNDCFAAGAAEGIDIRDPDDAPDYMVY